MIWGAQFSAAIASVQILRFPIRSIKMQILKIVQDVLKLIGLCSVSGKYLQFRQKLFGLFVLLVLVAGMSLGSAVYIFYHIQMGEVENSLYAFFQFAAAFGDANMILAISFQKDKVKKIIDELQNLYDQCKFVGAKIFTDQEFNFTFPICSDQYNFGNLLHECK